jgi:hypothetical protein
VPRDLSRGKEDRRAEGGRRREGLQREDQRRSVRSRGDGDDNRSPAECYAAAIGWTTPVSPRLLDMTRAMQDGDPLYDERHQDALRRMIAARGVDVEGSADVFWSVLCDLIREAKAGEMPMPALNELRHLDPPVRPAAPLFAAGGYPG